MNKYAVGRYITMGNSFTTLHYEYLLGVTTVCEIVRETCDMMWECLKPTYMSAGDTDGWTCMADKFYERPNFPKCIAANDGKHITMRKPNESGSQFFNYKNYFSMVLMLWQMQTVVSYQYKLEPTVCQVVLMCSYTQHLENYWRATN
jgi:hypothetical protein